MIIRSKISSARRPGKRRGAVAVELALAFSLVLMPMLLGIFELCSLLDASQTLVSAAREGGRQAATGLLTNSQVQQSVSMYLSSTGMNTTGIVVNVTNLTEPGVDASLANKNDQLQVTVTVPFKNVDWTFTQQFISDSSNFTTSCTWSSNNDSTYAVSSSAPYQ